MTVRSRIGFASLRPKLLENSLSEDDRVQLENSAVPNSSTTQASRRQLQSALTNLLLFCQLKGTVNSRLCRIHAGLGAVRCYQGRYLEAKAEYNTAYSIASRLGNEPQQAGLAANLEVCCHRLVENGGAVDVEFHREYERSVLGVPAYPSDLLSGLCAHDAWQD